MPRRSPARRSWADEMWGYKVGDPQADLSFDERDNAAFAPLAVVIDAAFTWGDDRPPQTPWNKTIIYEMHVKGFTKLHPDVPEKLRGTYAGLGSDAGDPLSARRWASRPSSCCRSIITSTIGTWSSRGW